MRPAPIPSTGLLETVLDCAVRRFEPLHPRDGGAHSRTFELGTDRGEYVLRIPRGRQGYYTAYLPPTVPRSRWFDQRWAIEQVRALNIPDPQIVLSHRRRPRFVVMTRLRGEPIRDYENWLGCPYDEAEFGATLIKLHGVSVSGYGPIDDAGRTYFPTWSAFLLAIADRALATCVARASISAELTASLRERWLPRLTRIQLARPSLLHLESLGFANLLYDPASRSMTGLLDYEDCIGGDPLFELTWMTYYYGDRSRSASAFDYQRFAEGYGPWPGDDGRERLYLALTYLEKLMWIDPRSVRAVDHRNALESMMSTM